MIDLLAEKPVPLSVLARREGVHISTPHRWCKRGCGGCVLGSYLSGGKRVTTEEEVIRWKLRRNGHGSVAGARSHQKLLPFVEAAERELDELLRSKPRRRRAR
jgi:hypothetical protein